MTASFGGNRVETFDADTPGTRVFAETPYGFAWSVLGPAESLELPDRRAWLAFVLEGEGATDEGGARQTVTKGDSALGQRIAARFVAGPAGATLLIASAPLPPDAATAPVSVTRSGEHYRVEKPWGYELWLTAEHPFFCLKEIKVGAGTRTSLQYHNHKTETILLVSGAVRLVYQAEGQPPPYADGAVPPLASTVLDAGSLIHVTPGVLHRVEAASDALFYEASTPHLDDVVRIQDDQQRGNGRLSQEHGRAG